MDIDLHDKNLNEAINYFMEKYNEFFSFKQEIRVIHGYGSSGVGGVIKKRFKELSEAYKTHFKVKYEDNLGITIVIPIKPLPIGNFLLEKELLEFCKENPKSYSKIQSKFIKKHTNDELKRAIKLLVKKSELEEILKKEINYIKKGEKI